MPANHHNSLSDLPAWFYVFIVFAGLSGELWRAEAEAGLTFGGLVKRITLRWGASVVFGACTGMLAIASGAPQLVAGASAGIVAVGGADLASILYSRWLKRKLRAVDEPA